MVNRDPKRTAIAEAVADFLLAEGLEAASLRPLAKAAGLSDRMLLYYFSDKAAVIEAGLHCAAGRLQAMLDAGTGAPKLDRPALLKRLAALMGQASLAPYMRLWLEIAARAARGEAPYTNVGEAIGRSFHAWGASQLAVRQDDDRSAEAARLFISLEGVVIARALGLNDLSDAALNSG